MLGPPRTTRVEMRVPAAIPYQSECGERKRRAHAFAQRGRVLLRVIGLIGALGSIGSIGGCGPTLTDAQAREHRGKLRAMLSEPVATRDQRDQHSRALLEVADSGALNGLSQLELREAIGAGSACRAEICGQNGFGESDWYYEVGVAESDEIKQLPVLIIGFDPRGRATRIWTLKTH